MGKSLAVAYQMKKKSKKYAEGGHVGSYQDGAHEMDMVGRAMHKRHGSAPAKTCYACGGEVANSQEDNGAGVDEDANQFDYLELAPPPEDDSSAGNEHGNEHGADHEDIVAKAMMKRKAKRG